MGRITSNIGLITGLPIADIVNQLAAIEARPRDVLVQRTATLRSQQTAITELTASILAVQFTARNLTKTELFTQRTAASSDATALSVSVTGTPALTSMQFTPLRAASAHQLFSSGVASDTAPVGAGTLSFRFGGEIDEDISLDLFNSGAGVQRGKIRITDRSGASSEIDLRYVRTVDDVLEAINTNATVNVTAVAAGDKLRLIDNTGQAASNLKVQEVGGGTTAASLGLSGINVAASQADGTDVLRLFNALNLTHLNSGNGVSIHESLADLKVEFRDGSSVFIDFKPVDSLTLHARATTTAANGINAQVTFTAVDAGAALAGVVVEFIDDAGVTQGNETVTYDSVTKKLTFRIDAGNTTANNIVTALNNDATANDFFRASLPTGGTGTGVIAVTDAATTALPTTIPNETTLADILNTLNTSAPSRLKAELDASGERIVLTDLTTNSGGTFQVTSPFGSGAPADLGLTTTASGGVITGRRLLSGLKTSLLASLSGGTGLGTLGNLNLTDRAGLTAAVNLAGAETIDDVVAAINAAPIGIDASINAARNGILLKDTTGAMASNLIVANGDATNTADKLQIAVNAAVTSVNSGNLKRQSMSESTLLSSLNGGAGVRKGKFRVVSSTGATFTVDISAASITTVGDVIEKIKDVVSGVDVRIDDSGDGLLLIDTAGGSGTLTVQESGGHTAADLNILGSAVSMTIGGAPGKGIDGSTTYSITLDADDTLGDLVTAINNLDRGVQAAAFNDGSAVNPLRLSLVSEQTGRAGRLLIDASALSLSFSESVKAQDALLLVGAPSNTFPGVLASSATSSFTGIVPGLKLDVLKASSTPVTITVSASDISLVAGVQALVDNYNTLREKLATATAFNAETNVAGPLLGDVAALRLEADLGDFLSGRFFGVGTLQSLGELGVELKDDGTLELDTQALKDKYAADPDAVEQFFAAADVGFAEKLDDLIEGLAGEDNSLLVNRLLALNDKVADNERRIDVLNERLDVFRERTLKQFADLEIAIARLKDSQSALSTLSILPPIRIRQTR
ncbi:MAG: flagellar filament capping protein FliD [Planctomycetia bacterium]|nr:flagellar filament capping protein FliD [Planctomycetia bacterium]